MSTNKKHKISEKEFDKLLGQAFLDLDLNNPKNVELMESVSNQALTPSYSSISFFKKSFFTKLVIAIVFISGVSLIYFLLTKTKNKDKVVTQVNKPVIINNDDIKITSSVEAADLVTKEKKKKLDNNIIQEDIVELPNEIANNEDHNSPLIESPKHQIPTNNYIDENEKIEDSTDVFPKLTEKEIKENHRRKKEMIEGDLAKISKHIYLPIPSGKLDYKGKELFISEFYIGTTEVTNLEYLTYILDLVIQNNRNEFLKSKPNQSLWITYFSDTHYNFSKLKQNYFSDKAYWKYPVVNISREGAENYCKWLLEETNKYLTSKNKPLISEFRLPTNHEWTYAANSGTVTSDFPWKTNSIQNKFGCFLANFNIKKFGAVKRDPKAKCQYNYPNAITSAGTILDSMQTTAFVSAYNPNNFGLYGISGNAAEMVYEDNLENKTRTHGTRGGSWYSDEEYLKLSSEDEFKNITQASPFIGFRPIFRLQSKFYIGSMERDDIITGLPTLTFEEEKTIAKQKKKMMDALIKFNKEKFAYINLGSCIYKKDTISVYPFYMQKTEVSNLEYRTFLADLLIQKRTEDYLLAKPHQKQWVTKFPNSYNEPMLNMYFSHPAYDEFPVVNITERAAKLYCNWLTIETNNYLKENNKPLINDLRIPDEYEWAYAASNSKNWVKYANGFDNLKDSKGKYTVNFMCAKKEDCKYDSIFKLLVPKSKAHSFVEDGGFHTTHVKSYAPNIFGLYCMAGNVSEMVINHQTKKVETKGGSWFSCDYFLEIDADDEYPGEEGPSPLIGFRPVISVNKIK